jgi:formamidopyrimidine-DNA glycosylase
MGKQIVLEGEDELYLVIHLMIAGRLRWLDPGKKPPRRLSLATLSFADGVLVLTEAGTKRRASIHVVRGRDKLDAFDRGGLEPLEADFESFAARLKLENHTLKRTLTDPRLFSGIGNAYSDEILHRARLSPLTWTSRLDDEGVRRLYDATRDVLEEWIDRLRSEARGGFPAKVTAFREGMAVHGRYGKACPVCGSPVQRIRYAENETNYCATCQTGGRLLADRALSRLLKDDWPKSIDEW